MKRNPRSKICPGCGRCSECGSYPPRDYLPGPPYKYIPSPYCVPTSPWAQPVTTWGQLDLTTATVPNTTTWQTFNTP